MIGGPMGPRTITRTGSWGLVVGGGSGEGEIALGADVDHDVVTVGHPAIEDGHRQAVTDLTLDEALQRPGAEGGIEPVAGQHVLGLRG